MKRYPSYLKTHACILVAGVWLGACAKDAGKRNTSGSSSSSANDTELTGGLASLPSMSSMLAANSDYASQSWSEQAVSGTAPLLKSLSSSNVDTYFFGGSIANLAAWSANPSSLTTAQKLATARNYRGQNGYAGGQGACRMAQETGSVFDRMLSNGTSACYMRKMPGATGAPSDTFAKGQEDKLVRVHVSHMSDDHGPGEMYVNIKVFGSNNSSAGSYKASLYFCAGTSGTPMSDNGYEVFEFNKATGQFTSSSYGASHNSEAKAFLKKVGDQILVDAARDRSAVFKSTYGGQSYKAEVVITGTNKVYNKAYNSGSWGSSRNYSVASFTGASMSDLRFTAGAFKGRGESTGCTYWNGVTTVACDPWSYDGGTEFQNTSYVSTTSSSLYAELASVNLQTDSFFSDLTVNAADLTQFDCAATPTATLEMDFATPAVIAVAAECEGERLFDNESSWQMCEGGRDHDRLIWEYLSEN